MFDDPEINWTATGPWRFYNYAILHAGGIPHVLDMMRYEPAFLLRRSDLTNIIDSANDKMDFMRRRFSLLLCKPGDKGIKKAGWWPQRLLSDQEYEYVTDHATLYTLVMNQQTGDLDFHVVPPLKWRGEVEITGTLAQVLTIMFEQRGFPAEEGMSHVIEQGFYDPSKVMTVKIAFFRPDDKTKYLKLKK